MVSPTPNKGYTYPAHGGAVNAWDSPLNTNFDQIDLNVGGYYPVTLNSSIAGATFNSSGATISSTVTSATPPSSIAQNMFYDFTGTLSGNLTFNLPAAGGIYGIRNASSGAFSLSISTPAGGAIPFAVPQGGASVLLVDGTSPQDITNKADNPVPLSEIASIATGTFIANPSSVAAAPVATTVGTGLTAVSSTNTIQVASSIISQYPPPALFKNLAIKVVTNTTVTVTADFVSLTDGTNFVTVGPVSATCNLGAAGAVNELDAGVIAAATFYSIWVIYNGTTVGTLASTSATAPTMPAGYTYKARLGWVKTADAVAQLFGTWQFNRQARYIVGLAQTTTARQMISGSSGNVSTPTWTAVSTSGFLPTTASRIAVVAHIHSGTNTVMTAPNNSYGANNSTSNPPPMMSRVPSSPGGMTSVLGEFTLESTNIYYACDDISGALYCYGWEDNI